MLSFQDIYEEVQGQVEDTDATSLVVIKRAINQGAKKFGAILGREWRTSEATFSLIASQQYYQMPEDAIRLRWVTVEVGDVTYPLKEIANEEAWQALNMTSTTSTVPEFFYIRGADEFGIWPIPAEAITDGGNISFERRMRDMAQADYTTGTVSITAGTASVLGSGTTFTQNMVGRYLAVTDGSADGMWYKINGYAAADTVTLENNYGGTTAVDATFRVCEVPDIPEEFHEALVDYACYRYYLRRRDRTLAREMKAAFDESLLECQANYSSKTGSQYYRPPKIRTGYYHYLNNQNVTGA